MTRTGTPPRLCNYAARQGMLVGWVEGAVKTEVAAAAGAGKLVIVEHDAATGRSRRM